MPKCVLSVIARYLNFWLFNILRQALACSVIHNCMDQLIRPQRPGPEIQYNHLVNSMNELPQAATTCLLRVSRR